MRLQNKTALVTGATSNLGKAIAMAFAKEGAHVVVSGRDEVRGIEVVKTIRAAGGRADFVVASLDGSRAASEQLAKAATHALGGQIDVLVNNAGIFPPSNTPATTESELAQVFGVNVYAPFFLVAAIAPEMAKRKSGAIINLGSWITRLGIPVAGAYSASKGALETLTRVWAAEFGAAGVRVNAISPGVVGEDLPGGAVHPADSMMHGTPYGKRGPAEAIGHAAVFLASEEASFVHGSILDVDGGRMSVAVMKG